MIQHATAGGGAPARTGAANDRPRPGETFLALLGSIATPPTLAVRAERSGGPSGRDGPVTADVVTAEPQPPVGFAAWHVAGLATATTPGVEPLGQGDADGHTNETGGFLAEDAVSASLVAEGAVPAGADQAPAPAEATAPPEGDGPQAQQGEATSPTIDAELAAAESTAPEPTAAEPTAAGTARAEDVAVRDHRPVAGAAAGADRRASSAPDAAEGRVSATRDGSEDVAPSAHRSVLRAAEQAQERLRAADAPHDTPTAAHDPAAPAERAAGHRNEPSAALTSTSLARLLDAIERLEQAPPPRQLTVELGELRVRLALEDGALRIQLLGDQRESDRGLLREATQALAARGFDLHDGDREGDRHDQMPPGMDGAPRPRAAERTAARLPAMGIHL